MHGLDHPAYKDFVEKVFGAMLDESGPITTSQDVAEAVWEAVTDPSSPMHIPAGEDAKQWWATRND
jgi:hypothetical protein